MLVPKKLGANNIKDFHPVSLVSKVYKIIAKVLVNKLKEVLEKVAFKFQNAFVKGCRVLDSVLVVNKCIDSRLSLGVLRMLCKLDILKAYDHMNWGFFCICLDDVVLGISGVGGFSFVSLLFRFQFWSAVPLKVIFEASKV